MASGALIKLALYGEPVVQSLSPRIHNMFADQCGLEVEYRAIEATHQSFPGLVADLADSGGRGCNITVPLKHDAWRMAGQSSESARRAQAANTLVFRGADNWFADSTDGTGLVNDLLSIPGCGLRGARVCLIGAGGAAASVLGALLHSGPEAVIVANRTQERAIDLAQAHSDMGNIDICAPAELSSRAAFDLVINATSLGHRGEAPQLASSWFTSHGLCYDLNYGDAAEPLRQSCRKNNIRYSDGLGMLVGQAALSFRLWTHQAPDTAQVLSLLRNPTG